jgi:hypothetical protein
MSLIAVGVWMEVEVWKLMVLRGLGFWVVIFHDEIKRLVLTTHKK